MKITAHQTYGPIKKGNQYSLIQEGRDWKLVSWQGKPIYVPYKVFECKS